MPKKLSTEALSVLSSVAIVGFHVHLPEGALDRKLYVEVDTALREAGGAWNRAAKAHVFDSDPTDRIEATILSGEVQTTKKDFDQFDSPPDVVYDVVQQALIKPGMKVLEPSAGLGFLAMGCYHMGAQTFFIEFDQRRYDVLKENPMLHDLVGNSADFLSVAPIKHFDRVVMNPPFSKRQDIKHVLHALKFLEPGGRLVSVMSAGVTFRQDKLTCELREIMDAHHSEIIHLPEGSFKSSGTMANTVIIVIDLAH